MPKRALESLTESMFYLLLALCRGPMCGIEIAQWVSEKTKGRCRLGPATLYTLLARFEQEAYIAELQADGRKRTYSITQKGREACREEARRLARCAQDALQEGMLDKTEDWNHGN